MGWLTGGTDGLQGVDIWPIFGRFEFDLWGYTAYAYALAVLFVGLLAARRIVHSAFGLSLRGIRENLNRMPAIGSPYRRRLQTIYTISAGMAGIAGALLTQTTETVSLDTLSFQRSADVVVMLILGGTGRLYGGILGAIIFMVARDQLADMNPQYWYFWIGLLLMVVVLLMPKGILGGLARLVGRSAADDGAGRRTAHRRPRQELRLAGGGARRLDLAAARRAPCVDRPERRRQDDAGQPDHRPAAAGFRAHAARRRRHHRRCRGRSASRPGWRAPSRSTRCFPT